MPSSYSSDVGFRLTRPGKCRGLIVAHFFVTDKNKNYLRSVIVPLESEYWAGYYIYTRIGKDRLYEGE